MNKKLIFSIIFGTFVNTATSTEEQRQLFDQRKNEEKLLVEQERQQLQQAKLKVLQAQQQQYLTNEKNDRGWMSHIQDPTFKIQIPAEDEKGPIVIWMKDKYIGSSSFFKKLGGRYSQKENGIVLPSTETNKKIMYHLMDADIQDSLGGKDNLSIFDSYLMRLEPQPFGLVFIHKKETQSTEHAQNIYNKIANAFGVSPIVLKNTAKDYTLFIPSAKIIPEKKFRQKTQKIADDIEDASTDEVTVPPFDLAERQEFYNERDRKKRIEEKREQEEREYKQREKELFEQELQIKKEYAESLKQARQQQQEYQDWAKNVKVPEFNPPKINWDLPKREPYVVPDFTKEMRPRDPKIDEENRKNWEKWEEENKQRKERMEARKKEFEEQIRIQEERIKALQEQYWGKERYQQLKQEQPVAQMQQQEQPQQKEQCFYFPAPKDGKIDKKEISQILENPEGENFSVSFSGKQIKIKTQNVENPEQKLEALKAKFGQDAKFLEEIPQPKKIIPTFFSNKQEPIQVNPILKEDIKNAVKDVTDYLTEKGTTFTGSDGRTYYKMSEQDEQNRQKAQQIFQNFLNKASEDDTIDNFFSQEFKSIKEALKETMTPEYIQKVRDQNGLTELYNSIKNFKNQEEKKINQTYDNRLRYLQSKYGEYDALDSYSYEAAVNATEREMQEALSDSEQRAKYQKLGLLSQYQELEDRLLYGKQNNNYKTF